MQQKNLQTKMIKDTYKQQVSDASKGWDFELCVTKIMVVLWAIGMAAICGYFIYLCLI